MAIEANEYGLAEVQTRLLELTAEVLRVCDAEHIPYTALAGTMLGAVREKGMIPWDDDVDLCFTPDALEKLVKALPDYSEICRIEREDTWVTRAVYRDRSRGNEFVDLFRMAPVKQNRIAQNLRIFRLKLLQGMLKKRVDYSRFSFGKRVLLFATGLLGKCFPEKWKLERYRQVATDTRHTDASWLFIPDGPFSFLKAEYPAKVMERFVPFPFENTEISVSSEYDAMLRMFYGDTYMQRPPEKDRHSTHDAQR